jgi:hypothetical protein
MKSLLFVCCLIVCIGCAEDRGSNYVAPADTEKPEVEIITPTDGSTIGPGQLKVQACAKDNICLKYVHFRFGKADLFTDESPPYIYYATISDTGANGYSPGAIISICATAVDCEFNWASDCVNVTVRY